MLAYRGRHLCVRGGDLFIAAAGAALRTAEEGRMAMWKPNDDKWGPTGIFDPVYQAKELAAQADPDVRRNFNAIVGSLAGKQFTTKDVEKISREVIDNISLQDAGLFQKMQPSKDGILRLDARQVKAVR